MATHAAYRLRTMLENARNIVAIELLAAVRGIGFRRPLVTSEALEGAVRTIEPAPTGGDRYISPDIARVAGLIERGAFTPLTAELFASMVPFLQ
jgi:histidine ammonia-lyase